MRGYVVGAMLSRARAARLAQQAERRRPDGTRGRLAARAWRILVHAGNTGDVMALQAVFQAKADRTRSYQYRSHSGLTERHVPSPGHDVEWALFLVLTGQSAKHLALDPDGSLLAKAYQAAADATRAELRRFLVSAGNLHIVRALTRERAADGHMTGEEIDHLARALANDREWTQLWALIREAPLDRAVAAMPLFGDWRPADATGAALFDRLAAADPQRITSLTRGAVVRVGEHWSDMHSFAPDASQIAIGYEKSVAVFTLPEGREVARYATKGWPRPVLHLGEAVVVYQERRGRNWRVVRSRPDRPREVLRRGWSSELARTPDGFVVSGLGGVWFGAVDGPLRRAPDIDPGHSRWIGTLLANDLASGRIAVIMHGSGPSYELALLGADLTTVARVPLGDSYDNVPSGGRMCGPDRVVTWKWDERWIRSWRRRDDALVLVAETTQDNLLFEYDDQTDVPLRWTTAVKLDGVTWVAPDTLTKVVGPPGFRSSDRDVSMSPDGLHAAAAASYSDSLDIRADGSTVRTPWSGGVDVYDLVLCEIAELVARPLAHARPWDLRTVSALESRDLGQDAREVVGLLRAHLEYRLGAEVSLGGTQRRPPADEHDIALGGG